MEISVRSEGVTDPVDYIVAEENFSSARPELHHYTSYQGLSGIFGTQTIRATHFSNLNDSSEVRLIRAPLVSELVERFKVLIKEKQKNNIRLVKKVVDGGGLKQVAENLAAGLVGSLYKVVFEGGGSIPFCETYIASLCSHAGEMYESENGLLSQWRGYGVDGGFCIVFDTAGLVRALTKEVDSWHYVRINISAVRYAVNGVSVQALFPELLDRCEVILNEIFDGNASPSATESFVPFVSGATLFKHQGFREEREVRIVAMPGSEALQKRVKAQHAEYVPKPIKEVGIVEDERGRRSHVTLFENCNTKLPIRRIIVGPSKNQEANFERAKALVRCRVEVTKSSTPFIG